MCTPGWSICCVLLTLFMSAGGLETSGCDNQVICSQGLSECTMEDEIYLIAENAMDIRSIKPYFKLCCLDGELCALCLVIDIEILIQPDSDTEDESHLRSDGEDYKPKATPLPVHSVPAESVTLCHNTAITMPVCKKVEFTVNHAALSHENKVKMTMVITKADGFPFSSEVFVYPAKQANLYQDVQAPSLNEVCSQDLWKHVPQCHVPTVNSVINQEKNWVELQFENKNDTLPSMCVQYEENGNCQEWTRATIPLHFVTPCMCLQLWDEDDWGRRLQLCPFNKPDFSDILQKNIWDNVSVSVRQGKMNNGGTMLLWNVSAPCRLEGEVWPYSGHRGGWKANAFRQQLAESQSEPGGKWKQNNKGHWEKSGIFENIDPKLLPCVMLKIKGFGHELGPFCIHKTGRSHWSLLVIGFMLLVCLMIILFYFFHTFVKKWVWSWRHGGFVKIGRKGHVVLLSPPDVDDGVSEAVCQLGSLLSSQGFSVSVDQWSRKEQCTLGPLPWLHSQLQKLDSLGGRILLVLTHKTLEKTEEWTHWTKDINKMQGEDKQLLWSPYADTFTASLFIMQADKQLGRAGERFLLVKFDSHPAQSHSRDRCLPEPLQGLPLFQLPSQTQSLLTELTVVEAERGSEKKTRTIPTWSTTGGCSAKTTKGLNQQSPSSCKYLGVANNHDPNPLNYP